jgi:hypothetical protein
MTMRNPTSPLREGFDYQDLWGLYLCCEWLQQPQKYQWLRFETKPDDTVTGSYYLDDVVLCDSNGDYHVYQIKHRHKPERDKWLWDDLLTQEKGSSGKLKDSLIIKWFKSYFNKELIGKIRFAAFVTNGSADDGLEKHLIKNNIDVGLVQSDDPEIYSALLKQLGDEKRIAQFFSEFHFLFERNFGKISLDDVETEVKSIFYSKLGATDDGVSNLLSQIHRECRREYTTNLTLDQVRQWCQFDNPRPLNENFFIPPDFEFFDQSRHDTILNDLLGAGGGVHVIVGKPGSGKSTYLSKLHQILVAKKIITIRHHYHISPNDVNPLERLFADRVEEAIKAQLKHHNEALSGLAYKNSGNIPLREYISQLAQHFHKQNKSCVVIIDGLDHVLRHTDKAELQELLHSICFPQPGMWIMLGLQRIAKDCLPQIVFDRCPENTWVEIKGLNRSAVREIITKNVVGLHMPDHQNQIDELVDNLFRMTQGNPLHLRYSLNQLKTQSSNRAVLPYDCEDLLPYGDDIAIYYASLWRSLDALGKTFVLILSYIQFRIKKRQLLELAVTIQKNPAIVSHAYSSISHLLSEDKKGLSIYHNSFRLFLLEQPEYGQQKIGIYTVLNEWIENSSYEDLKWAELRRVKYYLGNSTPILEIDKAWLIDAISKCRNHDQIVSQLELSAEAAFHEGAIGKVFTMANLSAYYENALEYNDETSHKIWVETYMANPTEEIDLSEISSEKIAIVMQQMEKSGKYNDFASEAINILNDMHEDMPLRTKGEIGSNLPRLPVNLIDVVCLNRGHDVSRIYKYIEQYDKTGWRIDYFSHYSTTLLETGQFNKIQELLKKSINAKERGVLLANCAEFDLKNRSQRYLELIYNHEHKELSLGCLLYLIINGKTLKVIPSLPNYDEFPETVPEHESQKRTYYRDMYSRYFKLGLIYGLTGRGEEIKGWIVASDHRWSLRMMVALYSAAINLADDVNSKRPIRYNVVLERMRSIQPLKWPENRDIYELQVSIVHAIRSFLQTIYLLKRGSGDSVGIASVELESIIAGDYFHRDDLLEFLVSIGEPLLSKETYDKYLEEELRIWEKRIETFPNRAEHYAMLAQLSRMHGETTNQMTLIRLAANNLLGHGSHKDIYLFNALEAIRVGGRIGIESTYIDSLLNRVAPLVANVTEYTDGDDTNHLPERYADVLADVNRSMLLKYYYHEAKEENLFLAEDIFRHIIRSGMYEKNVDRLLAITAVDKESFQELQSQASSNANAKEAYDIIEQYYGKIEYKDDDSRSSRSHSEENINPEERNEAFIKPEELEKHVNAIENKWEVDKFLIAWTRKSIANQDIDPKIIYSQISSFIEKKGLHEVEGELFDLLYPIVYEIDKEQAFEYLCWAQANGNGWDPHWTYQGIAEKRWSYVKSHYPERYMEFYEKSIVNSGKRYGRGDRYFTPIPRSLTYFATFNDKSRIVDILETSITYSEDLMANLELPACTWIYGSDVDEVDILLQRLSWPSPLVRERAAIALSLLLSTAEREQVLTRLLAWIKMQELESLIAVGLLPILKRVESFVITDNKWIKGDKVLEAIPFTSIVIEKLIDRLATLLEIPLELKVMPKAVTDCPLGYVTNEFFNKHIKGFLAPIYMTRAEEIESRTGRPFVKHWSFVASRIMEEMGLQERVGKAMDYMGGYHSPMLSGMSTMLSEVYRSAFLRLLQHYYKEGLIPEDYYLDYSYASVPIDLSLWKVQPGRAPGWWPKLQTDSRDDKDKVTLYQVAFKEDVERIIDTKEDYTLLGINGAVKPSEGWQTGFIDTSLSLVGFGYQVVGATIPEAKRVAKEVLYSPQFLLFPSRASKPFNYLDSFDDYVKIPDKPVRVDDLMIYPLVGTYHDLVIGLWQWFRDYRPQYIMHVNLISSGTTISIQRDYWSYEKQGETIARCKDWTEGLKERYEKDAEIPYGNYFEIKTTYLNEYLDKHNLRLGYLMKTHHSLKKERYEEEKALDNYEMLRVGRVIL